ncbi:GliK protein [Nannizzia gypsea CBS 118893]|uniref:gamma-glutamylcyclotransferase n=1 Tax=Arthroderma gypseum (strain ATCC MYA-4604 / CBS 118893) TaxID=535722 RepID=E4UZM9_ARTGP|nr:GliK protein [Nannizzia gypsea CBS 118893]EFR03559.1 GliK protein [Nannizzia gypsea CBS 118893]
MTMKEAPEGKRAELETQALIDAAWDSSTIKRRLSVSQSQQPEPPIIPHTSTGRQHAAAHDEAISINALEAERELIAEKPDNKAVLEERETQKTIFYLAYGSNMCSQTFRKMRKVTPLSQANVYVPNLCLTFDLPGIAYLEPCFAATQYRDQKTGMPIYPGKPQSPSDGGDLWHKPLVGVVYEVTMKDYARIIATEGGGASYIDVVIDCHPFPDDYDPAKPVPDIPDTEPFKAHTLLSPATAGKSHDNGTEKASSILNARFNRSPNYARPSPRYMKLLIMGAEEHDLPAEYRKYLSSVEPYRVTTAMQRIGQSIFGVVWVPPFLLNLRLNAIFANEDGRAPQWLATLQRYIYSGSWITYDLVFKHIFGDGERTIPPYTGLKIE